MGCDYPLARTHTYKYSSLYRDSVKNTQDAA